MLRTVLRRLRARLRGDGDSGRPASPLDRSVRHAHGSPDDEVERALADVEEQAERIESGRRDG